MMILKRVITFLWKYTHDAINYCTEQYYLITLQQLRYTLICPISQDFFLFLYFLTALVLINFFRLIWK